MKGQGVNFATVFILASLFAMIFAASAVIGIYGYLDHTYGHVALAFESHNSRCLHDACTVTPRHD